MIRETGRDISSVGCLALLWPGVDGCLVSPSVRAHLDQVTAGIAPLGRIALELRLGADAGDVDLHQFISGEADAAILKRYLSRDDHALPQGGQTRAFLRAWANDAEGLRADLDHVFLEWDHPSLDHDRAPAIFVPVQRSHERGALGMRRRALVVRHVDQLRLGGPRLAEQLLDIFAGASPDLSISYLGFMLGRSVQAVRINLRGIRPAGLADVLDRLGWPGDHSAWQPYFSALVERADTVTVALDFAPDLQPTIGFEAVLDGLPGLEPRWPQLLDHFVERGVCAAAKGAALKQVSHRLYPERPGQLWPASWLAAAAMAPADCVPWFESRLSHVKLSIAGDGSASAKAYVSAQHFWLRDDKAEPARPCPPKAATDDEALARAARRAADFLLAAQSQDDLWRDFRLVNGMSDEWVSGFVGFALADAAMNASKTRLERTLSALLGRQRSDGGWGYNAISPSDADSTAWVLKMLGRLKHDGDAVTRGRAFLRSHLLPGGGFATYAPATRISFGDGRSQLDDSGWRASHSCVAANAAALLPDPLRALLRSQQRPEGNWTAYWWRNDIYATALAVQALDGPDAAPIGRPACDWAQKQRGHARSAFDRAWLSLILASGEGPCRRQAREICLELASEQRDDGSWRSGAEMLFPRPDARHRSDRDSVILDHRCLYTTASVLMAIQESCARETRS